MENEPATRHDVTEGGVLGAVGGAVVGGLAGGPVGAIIGAVVGGAASAGAVNVVDKHDSDNTGVATGAAYHNSVDDEIEDDELVGDDLGTVTANDTRTSGYAFTPVTPVAPVTTGYAATTREDTIYGSGTTTAFRDNDSEAVIPVVEEELVVGKRVEQTGGARIHTTVTETPVEEAISLHDEKVTVNRTAVNRPATDADFTAGAVDISLTESHEVPVVAKEARVVEEVVIGKTATDRTETIHDTVRKTDVEVGELDGKTVRDSSY